MTGLQPFDPQALVLIAALNPVVPIVAFFMGRRANEPQKIVLAAFVAAIAGSALVALAIFSGFLPVKGAGGEGGIFIVQLAIGLFWAWVGYKFRKT